MTQHATTVISDRLNDARPQVTGRVGSIRDGLFCVLVFTACYFAARPFAEMGFLDDWSYAKSAQLFAQTGHFVYNGWASPMLGWLIPWGALFIRLFGFSFTVVKLSTLPIAMATVFVLHATLIRFGATPRNAVIAALTLGLSPLFLPLSASYMTDVPGLLVILVCIYCCKRAVDAPGSSGAIAWLAIAAASNVAGGTVRQAAWFCALVMVPSTAWFLRKRRGVLLAAGVLWVGAVAAIFGLTHWYEAQPYSAPSPMFYPGPLWQKFARTLFDSLGAFLCLALVVYPVFIAWLPKIRKANRKMLVNTAILVLVWMQWKQDWTLPWNPHLIVSEFARSRNAEMLPPDPSAFMLPFAGRLLFSALIFVTILVFRRSVIDEHQVRGALTRPAFWILVPFSLAYVVMLLPLISPLVFFDRYLLALMPVAMIILLEIRQREQTPDLSGLSMVTLVVYALLAVAATHDWFAWQRARIAAIAEVQATGVPRYQIQGGIEFDGWTQVENGGHINVIRIKNPPGAFDPNPRLPQVAKDCQLDFAPFTPSVQPVYSVVFGPKPCLQPTNFPPVEFTSWLPPFHRWVYVQKIPGK